MGRAIVAALGPQLLLQSPDVVSVESEERGLPEVVSTEELVGPKLGPSMDFGVPSCGRRASGCSAAPQSRQTQTWPRPRRCTRSPTP